MILTFNDGVVYYSCFNGVFMTKSISDRLQAMRKEMTHLGVDAFIIPREDEYLGEYVPTHNERLRWITGFTGSAGAAIILADSAAIFTDGRYTVQVRQQVDNQQFAFESLTDTPLEDYLIEKLSSGSKVAIDARMHTFAWFEKAKAKLDKAGIELVIIESNPIDKHWLDRNQAKAETIILLDEKLTGQSSVKKRQSIGLKIGNLGADLALITALDSIAWLLNIRGKDIPKLPVVLGTALLWKNGELSFFTDKQKLPHNISEHVGSDVTFIEEDKLAQTVSQLANKKILFDPNTANAAWPLLAQENGAVLIAGVEPTLLAKACKNPTELAGMKACHIRDGAAVCRFLAWLDREVATGNLYDEGELADKLESFRQQNENFVEPSFDTISAAASNAAMCHYNHQNGTPAKLSMNNLYLVDSGGQYLDGTTDVTRTIAIGEASAEQKKMVTLVLKGHIALDSTYFPRGTTGQQLDVLARQYLWQQGFDYDHGTGHGVGHFLSVHEGPQRIGKNANNVPLELGMVLSNEPGYYREQAYGIRLENLVVVQECEALVDTERKMYQFNAITLIPFDLRLIDKNLLTRAEIDWLNRYHSRVLNEVSPLLSGDDLAWLTQATRAI